MVSRVDVECGILLKSKRSTIKTAFHQAQLQIKKAKDKTTSCISVKLMIAVASISLLLGLTIMCFGNSDKLYNTKEDVESVITVDFDNSEHSVNHLLQDFRTNCFPPPAPYLPSRNRRSISFEDSVANSEDSKFKDNQTEDTIIWTVPENISLITGFQDGFMNTSQSSKTDEQLPMVGSTREEHTEQDYDEKGDELKDLKESELVLKLEVNDLKVEKNRPKWLKQKGMAEKVEGENSRVVEPEGAPATQHAFWKGEGDKETIRRAQGRLMKQYMDPTIDPCKDFYQYACGNWGKYNPIPKDKAAFDTFEVLRESLDLILRELLEEPVKANEPEAYIKTKHLYKSCSNYELLQQRGNTPLLSLLRSLGGWPILEGDAWNQSNFDWLWLMAQLRLYNNDILISEWVGPDIKNSDEYVIQFDQTSLGLPTRDYYLQSSNRAYLEAYKSYLIKIANLLGAPRERAIAEADKIINFEISLARITSGSDERKNVSELYQRMTVGQLRAYIPQIDWQRYLTIVLGRPCKQSETVVIFALRYVEDLVSLLGNTKPEIVSNYLLWRFVRHRVNNLDDRYQEAKQKFYHVLFGREQSPPRWKSCVAQVNSNMGMAVGAMFVRKYFDENSKNDTLIMTKEIQYAFLEILNMTSWIDTVTKSLAKEKVYSMMLRIGYPDYILESAKLNERYQNVHIGPHSYFENSLNILKHLTQVEQGHLGKPVNKSIWNTAPAVVNAYYSRNKNQIMFPAGILQPPFYHRYFPKSLNYGGIGVVIGHEITHGFDDKGRLFDKHGNLHRWWSDESINNFHERAQCIIEQYGRYVVEEVGMQLDGANTQGENIADNGGIKQAFRAYKRWLSENGNKDDQLPGLNATNYQLFFLNFAQVWCGDTRPEAARNKLKTAVHSPGKFRVIGTLSNSVDFSEVFHCPLGSPMNPVKKCSVW